MGAATPSAGPREIWIHAGLPKTGTTTIQLALRDNADWLAERGWRYPVAARQGLAHHRLVPAVIDPPPDMDWIDTAGAELALDELTAEIRATAPDRVILSSEALGRSPEATGRVVDRLRSAFPASRFVILVLLRRQDHNLEAYYNQTLKTGAVRATDADLARVSLADLDWLLDYRALLDRFADRTGGAELAVQPFEADQLRPGLVDVVLGLLGLRADEGLRRPGRTNERLNRHALEILRATPPGLRLIGPRYAALRDRLADWSRRTGPTPWEHLFPLDLRRAALERHEAGNRWIARELCRPGRDLLFLEPPPEDDSPPYPGLPPAEAAAILLDMWDHAFDEEERRRRGPGRAAPGRPR